MAFILVTWVVLSTTAWLLSASSRVSAVNGSLGVKA